MKHSSDIWLLFDCRYLCYRAFHTTRDLSHNEIKTGVIFGFLRDMVSIMDLFNTPNVIFCFDVNGSNARRAIHKPYKASRREEASTEELAAFEEMDKQIDRLRLKLLPKAGFPNILWQDGYEADDVIASLCKHTIPMTDTVVIVSGDKDFRQLIRPNVSLYDPTRQKRTTYSNFIKEFGIKPKRWAKVLAMAGCKTDEVPGIPSIGESTALKYLRGELKKSYKSYQAIESEDGQETIANNTRLVRIPFEGTNRFKVRAGHKVTKKRWKKLCAKFGIRSISTAYPLGTTV